MVGGAVVITLPILATLLMVVATVVVMEGMAVDTVTTDQEIMMIEIEIEIDTAEIMSESEIDLGIDQEKDMILGIEEIAEETGIDTTNHKVYNMCYSAPSVPCLR